MREVRSKEGMTLIEVLLAVAILGTGLVALLVGSTRGLAVLKAAHNYQKAQWVLDMGELENPEVKVEDVMDLEVDEVELMEGFVYKREVEEDDDEDGLYVVKSRVTWSTRGRNSYHEVVKYVLQIEDN